MIPAVHDRNETRTLFGVAALVVGGATAIALLAGLSAERERRSAAAARTVPVFDPRPVMHDSEPALGSTPVAPEPVSEVLAEEGASADPVLGAEVPATSDAALVSYRERDYAAAARGFAALAEARPGRAWTHYMLGLSLWKAGDAAVAGAALEEAARLDPRSAPTLVNLARVRIDASDHAGALDAAHDALAIDPDDPTARFLEGRALFNLGRLGEAEAAFRSSIELGPQNGFAHNALGLVLLRQERADEALPALERAAALEPRVAYVRNNLGMALELAGRHREAVAAYRAGAEIDPGHAAAVANLGRLGPLAEALATAEEVSGTPPVDGGALDVGLTVADAGVAP